MEIFDKILDFHTGLALHHITSEANISENSSLTYNKNAFSSYVHINESIFSNQRTSLKVVIGRSKMQHFISTEVERNAAWRKVSSGSHMVIQQRHMPSGKNKLERDFQISKHYLISQR